MRTIAFVSQKGGCGKSTLAACLAVTAQEAGERVFVLDLDPKKSILRWGSKRNDPHLPVEAVPSARLPAALTTLAKRNVSLVIVDTPLLESPRTLAAINAADLSIVPARPATFDIWASEVTGRAHRQGRDRGRSKRHRGPGNARPLAGLQAPAPANSNLPMSGALHPPIMVVTASPPRAIVDFRSLRCPLAGAPGSRFAGPFPQFPIAPSASRPFRDQSRA